MNFQKKKKKSEIGDSVRQTSYFEQHGLHLKVQCRIAFETKKQLMAWMEHGLQISLRIFARSPAG